MKDELTQVPFALILSAEGIALAYRSGEGWEGVGELDPADPNLTEGLAALRDKAEARAPGRLRTKLVIPDDQVRYMSLELGLVDDEQRHARVRHALDGATPYPLDELVYDVSVDGPVTHVAAVAIETLREAEEFARQAGFNPALFGALPGAAGFPAEAFFGTAGSFDEMPAAEEAETPPAPEPVAPAAPRTTSPAPAAPMRAEDPKPEPPARDEKAKAKDKIRKRNAMLTIAIVSVLLAVFIFGSGLFSGGADAPAPETPPEDAEPASDDTQSGALTPPSDPPMPTRVALTPVPSTFQPSTPEIYGPVAPADPPFAIASAKAASPRALTLSDLAVPSAVSMQAPSSTIRAPVAQSAPARFTVADALPAPRVDLVSAALPAGARRAPDAQTDRLDAFLSTLPVSRAATPTAAVLSRPAISGSTVSGPDLRDLILAATTPDASDIPDTLVAPLTLPAPDLAAVPADIADAEVPPEDTQLAQVQTPGTFPDAAISEALQEAVAPEEDEVTVVVLTSTDNVVLPRLRPKEPESPLSLEEREALAVAALSTPRLRPVVETPAVTVYQVASASAGPRLRPDGLAVPQPALAGSVRASTAAVQGQSAQSERVRATPRSQRIQPPVPSNRTVQQAATQRNELRMNRVSLLGVSGAPSARKALVRMPSGRIRKLEVGDNLDGGRVVAIGKSELRYLKSGQNLTLKMPRG